MTEMAEEDIQKMKEFETMKKTLIRQLMTKKAIERMGRLKLVKPELANQLELYLIQMYQSGQIKEVIDDKQLKEILNLLTSKKSFNIIR
jgi:programmed cell death protein 5